jgi:hypothetical protein
MVSRARTLYLQGSEIDLAAKLACYPYSRRRPWRTSCLMQPQRGLYVYIYLWNVFASSENSPKDCGWPSSLGLRRISTMRS